MMLNILMLLAGFFILIYGADKLVDAASSLAKSFNVPALVIGLTIVAFGTSAPELVVNVFAAISKSNDLVMGNVIGSNLFNVLAILGICAIISPLAVKTKTTWIEVPLSFLAAVIVWVLASDILLDRGSSNIISRSEGIILLFFFIVFLVHNIIVAKSGKDEGDIPSANYSRWKAVLFIFIGLAGLVGGGKLIVTGAVNIAAAAGLSERIIALTIVSIGTSLPELATSVVAVRKKNVDMAIGNVVGSNIFNIFFILGTSITISPVGVLKDNFSDIYANILASLLLFIFIFTGKGREVNRVEGIIFLAAYVGYMVYILV